MASGRLAARLIRSVTGIGVLSQQGATSVRPSDLSLAVYRSKHCSEGHLKHAGKIKSNSSDVTLSMKRAETGTKKI